MLLFLIFREKINLSYQVIVYVNPLYAVAAGLVGFMGRFRCSPFLMRLPSSHVALLVSDLSIIAVFLPFLHLCGLQSQIFGVRSEMGIPVICYVGLPTPLLHRVFLFTFTFQRSGRKQGALRKTFQLCVRLRMRCSVLTGYSQLRGYCIS